MSYSLLSMLPWFLVSFLVAAMHIVSAVILLRERHSGPWLMLAGSVLALVGQVGSLMIPMFLIRSGRPNIGMISATSALAGFGTLLFAVGLLLYVLHQRAKTDRVAELEAIIVSMQNR